jgi:hypothetical protein
MEAEAPDEARRLVGEELAAVIFVRDYIQLHFEGQIVTAYSPLTVEVEGTWLTPDARGWRDALCARINQVVRAAETLDQQEIRIEFMDGAVFSVSLRPDAFTGPEAAVLFDDTPGPMSRWAVWRVDD